MKAAISNMNGFENENIRELTADEMGGVRGGASMLEYALLIGGIALIAAGAVSVFK